MPVAAKHLLKRTSQQFVLEYGYWYQPAEHPDDISPGTPNQCHKNAVDLTLDNSNLIYCEGYALFKAGGFPTIHAWVTDGKGNAIDNTWPQTGVAYAGIPFMANYVSMTSLKNHATISLIDDYQNDFPLLTEIGDRPEEWLEQKGNGFSKISE